MNLWRALYETPEEGPPPDAVHNFLMNVPMLKALLPKGVPNADPGTPTVRGCCTAWPTLDSDFEGCS